MQNPITTISGALIMVIVLFQAYGFVNETEAKAWTDAIPVLVQATAAILLIFRSKDSKSLSPSNV